MYSKPDDDDNGDDDVDNDDDDDDNNDAHDADDDNDDDDEDDNMTSTLMPTCCAQATNLFATFLISQPAIQMTLSTFHLQLFQVGHPTHHHQTLKHLGFQSKNGTQTGTKFKHFIN